VVATRQCHAEGVGGEIVGDAMAHRPADGQTRAEIQKDGQIEAAIGYPQLGAVIRQRIRAAWVKPRVGGYPDMARRLNVALEPNTEPPLHVVFPIFQIKRDTTRAP
jgi:hypothetical protein